MVAAEDFTYAEKQTVHVCVFWWSGSSNSRL